MQEFTLVHYWMLGVMLVMVIYAGLALFGYHLQNKATRAKDNK